MSNNKISDRTKCTIDKFRDRTFMVKSNSKVYVIKFDDSMDVFDEDGVHIEYGKNNEIRYLEPKMQHSRRHYGTVNAILEVMEKVVLNKEDRANFERHMLKYA